MVFELTSILQRTIIYKSLDHMKISAPADSPRTHAFLGYCLTKWGTLNTDVIDLSETKRCFTARLMLIFMAMEKDWDEKVFPSRATACPHEDFYLREREREVFRLAFEATTEGIEEVLERKAINVLQTIMLGKEGIDWAECVFGLNPFSDTRSEGDLERMDIFCKIKNGKLK